MTRYFKKEYERYLEDGTPDDTFFVFWKITEKNEIWGWSEDEWLLRPRWTEAHQSGKTFPTHFSWFDGIEETTEEDFKSHLEAK